jgi:hypothetical protein
MKTTNLSRCRGKVLLGHAFSKDDQELLLVWADKSMSCVQASGDDEYVEITERVYADTGWFSLADLVSAGVDQAILDQYADKIATAAALVAADTEREERAMYARLKEKYGKEVASEVPSVD